MDNNPPFFGRGNGRKDYIGSESAGDDQRRRMITS